MRQPVSVIIPTYNRAAMLPRALESVLDQLTAQDEVVVVDDGSVDRTAAVIEEIRAKRGSTNGTIRYLFQDNAGAGAARNRGIREAAHDLVAFVDSDDEWLPGKASMQCALMAARPELVVCFGDFKLRYADGRVIDRGMVRWHQDARTWEERLGAPMNLSELAEWPKEQDVRVYMGDLYAAHMRACYLSAFTMMVRRSRAGAGFYFTEGIRMYEDWGCFGRLTEAGPAGFLDCDLAIQNGHREGRLTDADAFVRAVSRAVVLEEVWGADPEFLRTHGEEYRALLDQQRVVKAAGYLSQGQPAAARAQLAQVRKAPLSYRLLAMLPAPAVRGLLALRRAIRRG
ncbi:MAG TPA: glycosyltransferase family A protein [candidate division Zixibacteria bacterium]|nr:glycosyltransferase family 2 protein [candidate division Zixibacteria bacterium]MDD4918186.1 glycosyltransferase family A protein [candidate division Zixibacteria bacterium]MDM7973690.1 glycosyltransferase family A protein [candidate division Zixibacteria bacterium]HOD66551.1 glycosyltransferase family A protein [candidate division Zixibacteria bacterium]HOZ07394.1 glycosyltransferase family A protein [candidate division Zixibacteria bacterium]